MGTDMWTAVGRAKPKADGEVLLFEEVEIYSGDETNLSRSYKLYAFLGDDESNLTSDSSPTYIENLPALQLATTTFIEWLNEGYAKSPVKYQDKHGHDFIRLIGDDIYECKHFVGDRNHTRHAIKDLVSFNYDQPSVLFGEKVRTYRELFPDWWFKFLDWCVQEKWEFAIIGFCY